MWAGVGLAVAEIRIGQTAGFTGIAASSVKEILPAMIEGYAAAKMMVEGLCRAGRPTAGSLTNALETLNGFDSGGLKVSFSEGDHSVLDFADLSIINADGRSRR